MANASWIKNSVFYQIYPATFCDSNGDGVGDLNGITSKIDYVKSLGVDAVWLNPIYKSPFKDGGYDVTDYYTVDKKFGTLDDLKNLIKIFHSNGIKVILDIVFGHTSDKHAWFKKSACAKRNAYSDYYIWSDSIFNDDGGLNLIKGLYYRDGGYLMNYYASQPALNFGFNSPCTPWQMHYTDKRLAPLREELLKILRYYLDMGIDGFRFDMAGHMIKGELWDSDDPKLNEGHVWLWQKILGTLRKEYQEKVYIAEWVYPKNSVAKCGFDFDFFTHDTEPFNQLARYEHKTNLSRGLEKGNNYFSPNGKGTMKNFVKHIEDLYPIIDGKGYFCTPSGSHDEIRIGTFKNDDMLKTIFAFILTYKNIAFVYYGDEIGIRHNFNVSKDGGSVRTGTRTPMQWTNGFNRGFTNKKTPYLPTNNDENCSVESQENNENSILNTVKKLIAIRKNYSCLNAESTQTFIETDYPTIYERSDKNQTLRVYLNPSDKVIKRNCDFKEIIFSNNCDFNKNTIILKNQSFAIVKM